jgi:mono/diheme cytochrome c family protein
MREVRKIGAALALVIMALGGTCNAADEQDFSLIERGRYLTIAADCAACHTMPESGKPFAGGRPIETPFGTLLAPNITSDRDTGIGAWTGKEFISALKGGIGHGGTRLYPAMPYVYYTKMPDADVLAIWAYLQTLKPIRNAVEPNQLPFPFNIRASLIFWNWLYLQPGDWKPVPGKSPEWNRGAYLVEGPMHCGACHTPKSLLGGDLSSHKFQGYSIQGWHAPNITNSKELGVGSWAADQIVEYLKTGHNNTASASGPMAEEVELASQLMSGEDLKAVAAYLKDQGAPAVKTGTPIATSDPVMKAGQAIYADNCSACHREDGRGVPELFPALRDAPAVRAPDALSLIRVVVDGAKSASTEGAPTGPGMPSYAWQLNDDQIAAVLTYVRNSWGNAAGAVLKSDVQSAKPSFARMAN